jgi:hypothetical protein
MTTSSNALTPERMDMDRVDCLCKTAGKRELLRQVLEIGKGAPWLSNLTISLSPVLLSSHGGFDIGFKQLGVLKIIRSR